MFLSNRETRILKTIFLMWAVCSLGCGGDNDDQSSPNQGTRLEWDQQAESLQQVQSLSFRLYVDDVARPLSGASCRVSTGAVYLCAAPLPQLGSGRHVLQLASVLDGVESARSDPLEVSGNSGQSIIAQEPDAPISPESTTACLAGTTDCYAVRSVASGFAGVRVLSPAPDGRLFVVEGDTRVRVVAEGALVSEPAFALNDDQARIVGLAVDAWSFPENRFVFVAWTDETRSDHVQLNVTRYREVANTLGEGATILTGIPVPRDLAASVAVDRDGYVYVAVPALNQESPSTGGGAVLRITRDGRVPQDNNRGLPVFASGFSTPTSLLTDPGWKAIWLGGRNAASAYALGFIPTSSAGQTESPHLITQVTSEQPVSFMMSKEEHSPQVALFVLANGLLSKAIRTQDGTITSYTPLDLGKVRPVAAVTTESGAIYVATEAAIFELRRSQRP